MAPSTVSILADCPHCLVQAAVVELHEAGVGLVEARCRLCGHRSERGATRVAAASFATPGEVLDALARWAAEEGETDLERFCQANFAGATSAEVVERVLAREPVETGFDVMAFLFPGLAAGAAVPREVVVRPGRVLTHHGLGVEPPAPPPEVHPPVRTWDPFDAARALTSVMVADGVVRPAEERAVTRALQALRAPPVGPEARRVWRPGELGPPPNPAALLALCREVALADGEVDPTEVRLLEEYARAWEVPLNRAGLSRPTLLERVDRTIRGLLLT